MNINIFALNLLVFLSIGYYFKIENFLTILILITLINGVMSYFVIKDKNQQFLTTLIPTMVVVAIINIPLAQEFWNCLTTTNKTLALVSYSLLNAGVFATIIEIIGKNKVPEKFIQEIISKTAT